MTVLLLQKLVRASYGLKGLGRGKGKRCSFTNEQVKVRDEKEKKEVKIGRK